MTDPSPQASLSPHAAPLRIVLLGGGGLLGNALHRAWAAHPGIRLEEFARADLNLTRPELVDRVLEAAEFDVLVNCAAYTAVDDCEFHGSLAWAVNSEAPGQLARICARKGARLVHFSTDYVFSGEKETPYTEDDTPDPVSVYGRSKLEGERRVLAESPDHLVVRLAWLFGPGRPAFPEWIIGQAADRSDVRVVADKIGTPTYSPDVPRWLEPLLFRRVPCGGLLHLANQPAVTWLDWGRFVLQCAADQGIPLCTTEPHPVALAELPGLTARRPLQSALNTDRFTRLTGITPRPWQDAVREHLGPG